jgi:hypothetical protein
METKVKRALWAVGVTAFLLSGSMWAQQWVDWAGTSNNYIIVYRYRLLNNGKTCDLEFKDENQGDGYTKFDAAVDYQTTSESNSTAPTAPYDATGPNNSNNNNHAPSNNRTKKTETEHIVTTRDHNGGAQIPNCFGITEIRVTFVQRQ